MNKLFILRRIIASVFYYIFTYIIPKNKCLWVFGSWKGKNFSDNAKEFFIYVSRNHPEINAIWIAKNMSVYNEVKSLGYNVELYDKNKTKWLVARASANIQTESNQDTGSYRVGGAKVIQLFHGYGAVKEAYLYPEMSNLKKFIVKIYAENHSTSYWMVPSEYFVKRTPVLFDNNPQKIYITGQPRIDLLLSQKRVPYFENIKANNSGIKLIFYAPTHRDYAVSDKVDFTLENWVCFNEYCQENNYFLFFKPHPLELAKYIDNFCKFSNVYLLTNAMLDCPSDPYEYMHYFDMMISDYSSISTDFLVFDRPIIHFMYDMDSFESKNFTLDALNTFISGPICRSWNDLFEKISEAFIDDKYKNIRKKARCNAFAYIDNHNCERVFNEVVKIVAL